jgi:polysaccharide export outer membrane protein
MRLGNVLLLLMLAPIASGCASLPPLHQAAMQPSATTPLRNAEPPARAAWASSLDSMAYGEPNRIAAPPARKASNPFSALAALFERRQPAPPPAGMVVEAPPGPLVIPPAHMQLPTPKGIMAAPAATVVAAAPAPAPAPAPVALRGSTAMASAQPVVEVALPAAEVDGPYTVDTGDRLRIVVFGQEGLSNSYVVDAQGNLSLPLIGTIAARAHTTEELSGLIADRLRKGFIREPHVSIEVESYRPFFILGEVIAPGQYPYVPHMTVETAVAIAGGYTPRAYRWETHLDRRAGSGTVRTSVPPLAHIRPGDTLTVKERWF